MGIELRGKNGAIDLSLKMIKGDDGGYYIPSLDSEGNLTWAPSETEMPAVDGANIKGPKGDTGTSGVWVGDTEPTGDYNVWIDPTGSETAGLATKAELASKQDKLTPGDNITIDSNNIISATGLVTQAELANKQDKLTAGDNITIENNVISASAPPTATTSTLGLVKPDGTSITITDGVISSTQPTKTSDLINDSGFITNEYHDDTKQNVLVAGDNITIADDGTISSTQPTKTSELTNDSGFITNEYHDPEKQDKLTAGTNITIDSNNVISATGSGGGSSYTFTGGLTETDGTVKWDLNDRIKAGSGNGSLILHDEVSSAFNPTATNSIIHCYSGNISGSNHVILNAENVTVRGQNNLVSGESITLEGGVHNFFLGRGIMSPNNAQYGFGSNIDVKGSCGACFGEKTTQNGCYQIVSGLNNIPDSGGGWNKGTYAVIVGNGTWSSQANAYTLDWQGNGTFAGTVSSSAGADYAEYFEWKDGNPNNEDRVGYIVCLDGDKIVKANTGDDILGICSGTAMVLGDSAEWNWSKRYLTDDFGRIIYEDYDVDYKEDNGEITKRHIHAPKQNPDYDTTKAYTKRADRPEWQIVGMMGKLYVRDDGSCVVNGYADVVNGIATKATGKTNMRVMERINDSIVRVLLK